MGWPDFLGAEGNLVARADDKAAPTVDQLIAGKDRRLLVHTASKTGFEIETPLELLRENAVTPSSKLFVRNNQQPDWSATLEPPKPGPWTLEIRGLLEVPRAITLEEIKQVIMMGFKSAFMPMRERRSLLRRVSQELEELTRAPVSPELADLAEEDISAPIESPSVRARS